MPKLRIPSSFNVIRHGKDYLRNEWYICRDGFTDVLQNTFDVPVPLPRWHVLWKYDTFSRTFQVKTPLRITIVPHYWKRIPGSFESCREWLSDQLVNRFNQYSRYFAKIDDDFDIVQYITGAIRYCNYFDLVPFCTGRLLNKFDAITDFKHTKIRGNFRISTGNIRLKFPNNFDSLRYWTKDRLIGIFHRNASCRDHFRNRFDAVFSHDDLPPTSLLHSFYSFDILNRRLFQNPGRFDCLITLLPSIKACSLFDTIGHQFALWRMDTQAFVRPGWRIIARNILTGELFDIGFINTDSPDHSLTDIFLSDGDYEISVLTSSLFWKDAADKNIRMISIRDGEDVSSLPVIYNLRSSFSQGTTVIEWSANQSEADDCLFCLWYSSELPIDITRPADTTIWYSSSQTEYRTTFHQTAPAYVAVAAMRPGNEPELGNIHKLFLEWNSLPPRVPDDVMVLNTPFPVIDPNIETLHEDDPMLVLWR